MPRGNGPSAQERAQTTPATASAWQGARCWWRNNGDNDCIQVGVRGAEDDKKAVFMTVRW